MASRRDFLKAGTIGGSGLYLASKFGFIQRAFTQAVPGGSLDPYAIPRFVTPLVHSTGDAADQHGRRGRLLRGGRATDPAADPAERHAEHLGVGLRIDQPCGHVPFAGADLRGARRPRRARQVDQRSGRPQRQLPAAPAADRSDAALGESGRPARRHGHGPGAVRRSGAARRTSARRPHARRQRRLSRKPGTCRRRATFPPAMRPRAPGTSFFRKKAAARLPAPWARGTATFDYSNDQAATTLWAHDHTLGITRANVHAGLAAFYLLRGDALDTSLRGCCPDRRRWSAIRRRRLTSRSRS